MSDKDAHNIVICYADHAETRERNNHSFAGIIEYHLMVCRPAEEEIGTEAVSVSVCVISEPRPRDSKQSLDSLSSGRRSRAQRAVGGTSQIMPTSVDLTSMK